MNKILINFKNKLVLSILVLGFTQINAQHETTLSFMDNIYQSTYYSPFNKSDFKVSIGLPAISSVYVGAVNSGFTAADLFPNGFSQKLNPASAINNMKKTEFVSVGTSVDLFHVFAQKGAHGFSFNVTENINARYSYPSDMMKLALDGNDQFVGGKIDLSNFGVNAQHYREYAVGYYRTIDKWQFGAKAKMLFGKSVVSTSKSDLAIEISDGIYEYKATGDFQVNVGGYDFSKFGDNSSSKKGKNELDYLLNGGNKGFALDLGAAYEFSDKLQFNAALTNLGSIKWDVSPYQMSYAENREFAGVDIFKVLLENDPDSLNGGFKKYFKEEFSKEIKVDSSKKSFRTGIPTNFSLGARYELYKKTYAVGRVNFGAYKGLRTAFTVGVYHDFFKWLNVGLTNTSANGKAINPGLGLVLKGGPVQFYFVTDNLLAARFLRTNQINARFGLNMVFGKVKGQEKISSVID